MRYMQAMGTFEYALQLYRSMLRFFFGASKEVDEIIWKYSNIPLHFFDDLALSKYMYMYMYVMVKCTPIKVIQLFCWPMTPLIIGLPYNHPHPSGSRQFAYKNFGCYM